MPLMSFTPSTTSRARGVTTLLPTDHGPGDPVVGGVLAGCSIAWLKAGGAIPPSLATGYVVPSIPSGSS